MSAPTEIDPNIAARAESLASVRCRCSHDGDDGKCQHRREGRCHISADEIGRALQEERNAWRFLKQMLDKEREEHKAAIEAKRRRWRHGRSRRAWNLST